VAGDATELADAVVEVLSAAAKPNTAGPLRVECASQGDELVLVVRNADDGNATQGVFDPWRGPGLQTVIACRTIVRAGGTWTAEGPERVRAALPWAPRTQGTAPSA
jgi:hypothetical protein